VPPIMPHTKAPRRMECSDLYQNRLHSTQGTCNRDLRTSKAPLKSQAKFSKDYLLIPLAASEPNPEADNGFVGANSHTKMPRHLTGLCTTIFLNCHAERSRHYQAPATGAEDRKRLERNPTLLGVHWQGKVR